MVTCRRVAEYPMAYFLIVIDKRLEHVLEHTFEKYLDKSFQLFF